MPLPPTDLGVFSGFYMLYVELGHSMVTSSRQ